MWARRPLLTTTALTAAGVWAADLAALAVKAAVGRPRPYERLPEADPLLDTVVGASFPSGHAATSFAGAIVLTLLVGRAVPALFVLAVLVSFSRVYVGVHYPTDVVGGAALGAVVALSAVWAFRTLPRLSGARRRSAAPPPPG